MSEAQYAKYFYKCKKKGLRIRFKDSVHFEIMWQNDKIKQDLISFYEDIVAH